jgi:hypothetical protein
MIFDLLKAAEARKEKFKKSKALCDDWWSNQWNYVFCNDLWWTIVEFVKNWSTICDKLCYDSCNSLLAFVLNLPYCQ